eukprot:3841289-Rhodomonas_salina.2
MPTPTPQTHTQLPDDQHTAPRSSLHARPPLHEHASTHSHLHLGKVGQDQLDFAEVRVDSQPARLLGRQPDVDRHTAVPARRLRVVVRVQTVLDALDDHILVMAATPLRVRQNRTRGRPGRGTHRQRSCCAKPMARIDTVNGRVEWRRLGPDDLEAQREVPQAVEADALAADIHQPGRETPRQYRTVGREPRRERGRK